MACLVSVLSFANQPLSLDDALRATYNACVGIDDALYDLKKMAGINTAITAVGTAAGAFVAGTNKVDGDLDAQITACKDSLSVLRSSIMQSRINGEDISEAQSIESACSEFEYVDLSKINKRAQGAMISSEIGAATGLAGTLTSVSANSDKVRNDNSDSSKQKEKNLNAASNVLSGATAAASATATVFNATQIKAIKQVAEVSAKCTGINATGVQLPFAAPAAYFVINAEFTDGVVQNYNGVLSETDGALHNRNYNKIKEL